MYHVWPISKRFMFGWFGGMWPACCHWLNTGTLGGRCPIMFVFTQSYQCDTWFLCSTLRGYSLHDKLTRNFVNGSSSRSLRKKSSSFAVDGPWNALHACHAPNSYLARTNPFPLNLTDLLESDFVLPGMCMAHNTHVTHVTRCTHCTQGTPPLAHCRWMSLTSWREALWLQAYVRAHRTHVTRCTHVTHCTHCTQCAQATHCTQCTQVTHCTHCMQITRVTHRTHCTQVTHCTHYTQCTQVTHQLFRTARRSGTTQWACCQNGMPSSHACPAPTTHGRQCTHVTHCTHCTHYTHVTQLVKNNWRCA